MEGTDLEFVALEVWQMRVIRRGLRLSEGILQELDQLLTSPQIANVENLKLMLFLYRPVIEAAIRQTDEARILNFVTVPVQ